MQNCQNSKAKQIQFLAWSNHKLFSIMLSLVTSTLKSSPEADIVDAMHALEHIYNHCWDSKHSIFSKFYCYMLLWICILSSLRVFFLIYICISLCHSTTWICFKELICHEYISIMVRVFCSGHDYFIVIIGWILPIGFFEG